MIKNIIKYGGLALVLVGIIIVMSNLFTNDTEWKNNKKSSIFNKNTYYSAKVSLLDKETKSYISGASLVVKDKSGSVISGWTTDGGVHLITNLKKGTYTLIQENVPDGYHLNNDKITFEITNKDETVVMYNIKMTEEEKNNQTNESTSEDKNKTPTSSEIGVENTLSTKNIFSYVIAIICISLGVKIIYKKNEIN